MMLYVFFVHHSVFIDVLLESRGFAGASVASTDAKIITRSRTATPFYSLMVEAAFELMGGTLPCPSLVRGTDFHILLVEKNVEAP